jgi:hypothetical protein
MASTYDSPTGWYRELDPGERRTFWACFGGWTLDAMDVQIFQLCDPGDHCRLRNYQCGCRADRHRDVAHFRLRLHLGDYSDKALEAMGKNPNTNRREAVEQLLTAAGGKLVAMYGTIADGPGAMVIFDADPVAAPAVTGVAASTDGLQNVKLQRLFTGDEVVAIRQKRTQVQGSFKAPGQ